MLMDSIKKLSFFAFMSLSVGCTSLQIEQSLEALGDGITGNVESRNQSKPQHEQNNDVQDADLISGLFNIVFQGIVGLFDSEEG